MIGIGKDRCSPSKSDKYLVSSRTPKHCNKSSLHGETPKHCNKSSAHDEKGYQNSPSTKTQKSHQQALPAEDWDYKHSRAHPAQRILTNEYPTENSMLLYNRNLHDQRSEGFGQPFYGRPWMMYDSSDKATHMISRELGQAYHDRKSSNASHVVFNDGKSVPIFQNEGSFSRAISSSFGELTKTSFDKRLPDGPTNIKSQEHFDQYLDNRSRISDADSDSSWKALHQVASVDEEIFSRQLSKNQGLSPLHNDEVCRESPFDGIQHSSSSLSNSSSSVLIHSFPTPSKLIRLNSLSSVASTQKPLETCVTYDSKTQTAFCYNEDTSLDSRTRKMSSPNESDSARKKPRCSSPSSFTNFQGPCFTLSLDSMNSFSNDENHQSQYSAPTIYSASNPLLSDTKSSWDLSDRIVGTFTFDTCESLGDSSGGVTSRNPDQVINQAIPYRLELTNGHGKTNVNQAHAYSFMDPTQEKRNPSFDSYFDPRINFSDGKRDDISSKSSENRDDMISDQSFVPNSWNHHYVSNYGPSFYHQHANHGQNIANNMDCNVHQGSHTVNGRYPPYLPLPQEGTKINSNIDYRPYWSQFNYMYPNYGINDYWRMSTNSFYGKNGSEVMAGPPNTHQPKVYNKWAAEDDALLTSIMRTNKYDEGDFHSVATEIGRGKSAKECEARWLRYLKPGARKGQWQDFEDALVIDTVLSSKEQPFTKWSDLAQRLPGRVGKQIRDRWINHLNPNINHNPFTPEEDLLLWEGHKKFGNKWVEISVKCFHSSRSENHIKNRFYSASFKKYVISEFGEDAYKERSLCDDKVGFDDGKVAPSHSDETLDDVTNMAPLGVYI